MNGLKSGLEEEPYS